MLAGRDRHDELMREFALLALSGPSTALPACLLELTEILGVRYGGATARPEAEIEAAAARGEATVDLTYVVPAHVLEGADLLDRLMAEADDFCRAEQLLTLPRNELMVQFADWYLEQFRRQIAGEPPQPWTGPLDPD